MRVMAGHVTSGTTAAVLAVTCQGGAGQDRRVPGEKTITLGRDAPDGRTDGARTPKTDGPTPPQVILMHIYCCCKLFAIEA